MRKRLPRFLFPSTVLALILSLSTVSAFSADMKTLEPLNKSLLAADNVWISESPKAAIPKYKTLLDNLTPDEAFIRPVLIIRIARAELAAGNKDACLAALSKLDSVGYVPKHILMAAAELKASIAGKPNPGFAKTPVPPIETPEKTWYVSPNAKTKGNGSKNAPFAELADAVAAAKASNAKGRKAVILLPGVHIMDNPAVIKEIDNLTIRSADPENPATLTCGVVLGKWTRLTDKTLLERLPKSVADKVLFCDLSRNGVPKLGPLVFGGFASQRSVGGSHRFKTMPLPELFYDRTAQPMATWPNKGYTRLPVLEKPKTDVERYRRWAKETNLWLHGYWKPSWADAYEKVASIDENGVITPEKPVNHYGFGRRMGRAVNALCELDVPGEWYYDSAENAVVYLPPNGFDPKKCVVSAFETPIVAEKCRGLRIRNVKIDYVRGDAMILADCRSILLFDVAISECSGLGIRVRGGKDNIVHSCAVNNMGRGGMDILGGDWEKLVPGNTVVENCRIFNLSRIDRTYTPALLAEGMGLKIQRNEFKNIPSSAIRLEACDALIQLNVFKRCVYESGDQGAIDMWANPLYRGNVIRWNFFDSIRNPKAHLGAAAVRCDDFISGFMVAENVMLRGTDHGFGAVQFNQGYDNFVEGNVVVDWNKAFTGRSLTPKDWKKRVDKHPNAKKVLAETAWQSDAWKKKYPRVATLFTDKEKHNYLVGNTLVDVKIPRAVQFGIFIANRKVDAKVENLDDAAKISPPWHAIPVKHIGPYRLTGNR